MRTNSTRSRRRSPLRLSADARRDLVALIGASLLLVTGAGIAATPVGRIELSPSPAQLTLGENKEAEIRVRILDAQGAPVEGAGVQLRASAGRFRKITPAGPGEHLAVYQPPENFFPRFALVAAVSKTPAGTVHGFLVLPLFGMGEAEVRSRPGASVTVRIGDASFGPVRVGRGGRALVPVIVPPGIREAKAGERTIDLKIPSASRVVAIAEREKLAADGSERTTIRIYTITELGQPALEQPIAIADRGPIDPPRLIGPGIFETTYSLAAEIGEGLVRIAVSLPNDPTSKDTIELRLVPGPPHKIALQPERSRYQAGQGGKIRLVIELLDRSGNPVTEAPLLQANLGALDAPKAIGPGLFESHLTIPDVFESQTHLQIEARAIGARAASAIELLPGTASALDLQAPADPIVADGISPSQLPLEARDTFGNPSALPSDLRASAAPGSAAVVDGRVHFTPPLLRLQGDARVLVQAGGMSAEAPIELVPLPYWLELGALIGLNSNLGHVFGLAVAVQTAANLGLPGLTLLVDCGYLRSETDSLSQGIEAHLEVVPVLGAFAYRLFVHRRVHLSVGAGVGVYFVRHATKLRDEPEVTRHFSLFGYHGDLGLGIHLGPGHIALDTRLALADLNARDIVGNVSGLQVLLGYRLGLF